MKKTKTNKIYSLTKKREYTTLLNQKLRFLRNLEVDSVIYKSAAQEMIKEIRALSETEALFLPVVPVSMRKKVLEKVTVNISTIVRGRFLRTIRTMWEEVYSLGKKHAVTDLLMDTGLFNNQFKRNASFSSLEGISLTEWLNDKETAEFAEREDLTPAQRRAISRAKRNLTILRNNVNRLKAEGVLYNSFDLEKGTGKAARLTIEERIRFLQMVQEIDDLLRKAEASEKTFLSDEYLQRRYRVLTQDYADMYDTYIKEQMASYLDKNIEGIRQIINKEQDAQQLASRLATQIENANVELVKPDVKAEMILRTELGLAYNFGKLLGFTSPTDLNRKFRWNADWELEGKADYEVCKACERMDGRIFTVQDLLTVGTRLDRGILNYQGQTRTDFKNPTMPMIPFHPNCVPAGVSVLCYNKEVNIEDVKVNDLVYVPTSKQYEVVTKTHKNWYDGKLYKIRFSNGKECTYTTNHPIWTSQGWVEAGGLRKGDTTFTYFENIYTSMQSVSRNPTSENCLQNIKGIRKNSCKNTETNNTAQNSPGYFNRKKQISETASNLLREHETKQPYVYAWGSYESQRQSIKEWFARVSLQIKNWERSLSNWLQTGYWSICQKFLGSQCSSNTQEIKHPMGIRKTDRTFRWKTVSNGFLFTKLGCLFRGKRLLGRGCQTEVPAITTRTTSITDSIDRPILLQATNQEFQGLVPVRVVSIETYIEPQYVYNLTVENAEVYFANGILTHNCSCYWTLMPDDDPAEDYAERYVDTNIPPPPLTPISGTQEDVERLQDQTIPITVASGLLVGGLFLLARSNVWRLFYRTAVEAVDDVVRPSTTQQVIDVSKFLVDEVPEEIVTRYKDILDTTIRTLPEELPSIPTPV